MSNPFGQAPTLNDYLAWANLQGCEVATGYRLTKAGPVSMVKVTPLKGGRPVHIVDLPGTTRLPPSIIGGYDRRLGVKSPWFTASGF